MKMGMSAKVIILFLIAGIVPFAVTGIMSKKMSATSLKEQAFSQLVSVRETKKKQIEDYFSNIRKQVQTFSEDRMIVDAMKEFKAAFKEFIIENDITDLKLEEYREALKDYYTHVFVEEYKRLNNGLVPDIDKYFDRLDDDSIVLQYHYICLNDNKLGEKHKLNYANDKSTYSKLHAEYHPIFRNYLQQFGYYDIFLIDPDSGDIIYSVFKEVDFSTSLKNGPFARTIFGRSFNETNNKSDNPDYVKLVDFGPYAPSYEGAASFISSPIYDGPEKIGILVFQMPIEKINMVMTSNNDWKGVGLGESGETYLIGDDFTMRSQSRFLIEDEEGYFTQMEKLGVEQSFLNIIKATGSTILLQKINTKGTRAANSGKTQVEVFPDYRNVNVLSAYAPLEIEDLDWAIMAEIDEEEALRPAAILAKRMLIISLFMIILIIGLSYLVIKVTSKVTNVIKKTISGLTECAVQISSASEHVSSSSQNMAQNASEQASSIEETSASMEEMSSMTKQNADSSEEVAKIVDKCSTLAENGNESAEEVNNSMKDISAGSKKIAEITKIIDGIASQTNVLALKASEETSKVIKQGNGFAVVSKEVKNLANQSTSAAKDARALIEDCIAKMETKSVGGEQNEFLVKIKEVSNGINMINSIAFQTNLLALNAAVEAAHASDHGSNFASIAEEVRNLATRSGDAAKDITALIGESVAKAGTGVKVASKCREVLKAIVKDVKKASELTKGITSASKEQSEGISQVNNAVQQMDQITQQNAATAEETASSSEELSAQSQTMKEQIRTLALQVGGKDDGGPTNPNDNLEKQDRVGFSWRSMLSISRLKAMLGGGKDDGRSTKPNDKLEKQDKPGLSWRSMRSMLSISRLKAMLGGGKGNEGNKDVIIQADPDDKVIPMGGNSVQEHDERFKDF